MRSRYFADEPVSISRLPSFRAENFPYSGPYPWLDRPNAMEEIENRLKRGEIDQTDADRCRQWSSHGYMILENLIDGAIIDSVWKAYEQAIRDGRITPRRSPAVKTTPSRAVF